MKPVTAALFCRVCPGDLLVRHSTVCSYTRRLSMSFSLIPDAVLANCLAPFFIFEHSCDPARADQAQDGHRLLLLRRWSKEQTALIKRKMTRVSAKNQCRYLWGRLVERTELSAQETVELEDSKSLQGMVDSVRDWWFGNPYRFAVVKRYRLSPYYVHVWDENQQRWAEKPHPILLPLQRDCTFANWRRSWGKTI